MFTPRYLLLSAAAATCVAVSTFVPASVFAQTRLAWPENTLDLSRYTTVEECLAIVYRVRDSIEVPRSQQRATTSFSADAFSLPPAVVSLAQRCSAKWSATSAPLADFSYLMTLLLMANRDADVATLVARRMATVPAGSDTAIRALLDSMVLTYLDAAPARLSIVEETLQATERLPRTSHGVSLLILRLDQLIAKADLYADPDRVQRVSLKVSELAATLTAADKSVRLWANAKFAIYRAYTYLSWAAQLDSLRLGTPGYVALARSNWTNATDEPKHLTQFPIGERAQPLAADFWFTSMTSGNRTDTSGSLTSAAGGPRSAPAMAPEPTRPTRGALSLVLFLDNCHGLGLQCWEAYAVLKRLHQRFPDVEITVVSLTHGFFMEQVPPPPDVEADWLRQWWLDFHELPAMLAVTKTTFWRLPDPDRRRIDEPMTNQTQYTFGSWQANTLTGYLIDREGTILESTRLNRTTERRFHELLTALYEREK